MDLIDRDLYETVLIRPAHDSRGTELCIVSGYAEPGMAWDHWQGHLLEQIRIRLLIGMPPDGDERRLTAFLVKRQEFQQLTEYSTLPDFDGRFECRYVVSGPPIHSKLYVWLGDDGTPGWAYVGSPNYSQSAFNSAKRGEIVASDSANADECYAYFRRHWGRGMDCGDPTLESRLRQLSRRWIGTN